MGKLDGNLVSGLLSYAPAYLLYGTIVTLFFSSLGVLLSCIAKRKVVALLPLLAIMIVTLGLPIVFRIVMEFASVEMNPILSLVDLNYHFSSIFRWCCDLCGGIQLRVSLANGRLISKGKYRVIYLNSRIFIIRTQYNCISEKGYSADRSCKSSQSNNP